MISKNCRFALAFGFMSMLCNAQHPNILISNNGFPNEPSIMINPKNPALQVAGSNPYWFYYSNDSGNTWTQGFLFSQWVTYGDPCIITDTSGTFYYFHLSDPGPNNWLDRIVCQKSTDGINWTQGSYTKPSAPKQQDKEWAVVDPRTNHIYMTWTEFDKYGSNAATDSSRILFSKSIDTGASWTTPVRINRKNGDCIDMDSTVEGAVPAVGPNGELYVSWAGPEGLRFDRSLDGGQSWLQNDILIDSMPGGWDLTIPGIFRCNGLPVTVCDNTNSAYKGNIYVNWSDQRNGITDTDIWFIKSSDKGNSWSQRIRVNNDGPGKHQFMSWMTIDPSNGYIYIVYYDRRNHNDHGTDVYLALSVNGGDTWKNVKISETAFFPNSNVFFGDYNNISAINGIVRPIWTRLDGNSLKLMTAKVNSAAIIHAALGNEKPAPLSDLEEHYPNPSVQMLYVPFKLKYAAKMSIHIYNSLGEEIAAPLLSTPYEAGKHVYALDVSHMKSGTYYYLLNNGTTVTRKKFVVLN